MILRPRLAMSRSLQFDTPFQGMFNFFVPLPSGRRMVNCINPEECV
jgi:hypothetical protein